VGVGINDVWCKEVSRVKSQVKRYFESRFRARSGVKINLDGVNFKNIFVVDNDLLCRNITKVEVLEAVSQCGSSKSPGLDGFNFSLLKGTGKSLVWIFSGLHLASRVHDLFREGVMHRL